MAGIKDYSTTAANNNSAPPNGWPEGMAPSAVNNSARQNMADVRDWYEDAQWINLGHTCTQTAATTFTIAADVTSEYTAGRAIRIVDSSTLYRTVVSSSFSSPNTTITIDSGTLTSSMNGQTVSLGAITPTNDAFPRTYLHNQTAIASLTDSDALMFADSRSTGLADLHKKMLWSNFKTNFLSPVAGVLTVTADASQSARVRLPEDTDNGSNYIELAAPAAVTSDTTFTLPDGPAAAAGYVLTDSDAAGTLAWRAPQATDSSAKAWVIFDASSGTPSILDSFNVTSITDDGVGLFRVNLTTAFATTSYVAVAQTQTVSPSPITVVTERSVIARTASAWPLRVVNPHDGVSVDAAWISVVFYGDQ